jgi:hypothetical protein
LLRDGKAEKTVFLDNNSRQEKRIAKVKSLKKRLFLSDFDMFSPY